VELVGHVTGQLRREPMPMNTRSTSVTAADDMSPIESKLDLLLKDMAEVKRNNKQFTTDVSEIKADLKQFKQDITSSIDMCFGKIEDVNKDVEVNKKLLDQQKEVIDSLTSTVSVLEKRVFSLQQVVETTNQYSRSNCLEIHGVPETKSENIMDVVKGVARVLNFNLKEEMIDAVHRLSKNVNKPEAPRGIIIKFCRRIDMEALRNKTRVKNGFSAAELGLQSESKVYVNLSLTPYVRMLWNEVRAFKVKHNFKYAWITSAGKVFLRERDGTRAFLINHKCDLDHIM